MKNPKNILLGLWGDEISEISDRRKSLEIRPDEIEFVKQAIIYEKQKREKSIKEAEKIKNEKIRRRFIEIDTGIMNLFERILKRIEKIEEYNFNIYWLKLEILRKENYGGLNEQD